MDRSIRRLGVFLMLCFGALFVQLNYIQVVRASHLNTKPDNDRAVVQAFSRPRGTISTADGVLLAKSVPSDDRYQYQRQYPEGETYAALTGFFNYSRGATGLERAYNDELSGKTAKQQLRSVGDLFVKNDRTGNLKLSVRSDIQEVAKAALGDQKGSVVALDPRTGEILALWSNPTYDPNLLASHDFKKSEAAYKLYDAAPGNPLLAKAYREVYPPGSTFKTVTGSTGVQTGQVTPDTPVYPTIRALKIPGTTRLLPNFGGEACGGTLFTVLAKSCNTSFAQMGLDLGADNMINGAQAFGFNSTPPFDLPAVASRFRTDFTQNEAALAQSSIGQNDTVATPLQMALVAGGIANNGVIMAPHVVSEIRDSQGDLVSKHDPTQWKQAISPQTADTMRQGMREVVATGSATRLQIPGYDVGAKTGTAQFGPAAPLRSHAWVIAWAAVPGQQASIAVAVIVEDQSGASESTGGRLAAPIAKQVIEQAFKPMPAPPADTTTTAPGTTSTTAAN
ncbi:peptidoglycan D,D-transpeptidase FtsI family protein [Aquihabitans sp. McL0605]|uniref:peptidoglycan D,D-transpeptidase FtsI family protein n=1 Tax=Aquihabitans sp. McL0605 TaxID=3415671 RepID=UPI003CF11B4C